MDGMVGNVGGTNHVIELFSSKGQACRVSDSQSEFQSQFQSRIHFIHSFSHSLTHSPAASFTVGQFCVCASIFIPKTIFGAWRPTTNGQPTTVDVLQFCICVYIAGIQFLFITHSAAKLFLNCPYQLRNEIYYLACVYRQCPVVFLRQSSLLLSACIFACLPHHYQAQLNPSRAPRSRGGSWSRESGVPGIGRYFPPASSTSLVLCAVPTTFCIFT